MVLDAGEVKEFAPPKELLRDEESRFYSLAKQAGLMLLEDTSSYKDLALSSS